MPLPASGAIRFSDINTELGLTSTAQISLNDAAVRTLFAVPSGAISMSNGYGKANAFSFTPTIAVNTTNYNLKTAAIAAGWDQVRPLAATVTINAGVYVYSTSTGSYAFDTGATFPTGTTLALINNGIILGMGGVGGANAYVLNSPPYGIVNGTSGGVGGPALRAQYAISITNNGSIAGGGGGGGGGAPTWIGG
jgi:hypothetical protein